MTRRIFGLMALLASILAAPSQADAQGADERDRFGIELEVGTRLVYSGGYQLFSQRPGLVNAQAAFAWLPGSFRQRLALDLRLAQAGSRTTNFNVIESRLNVFTAMIGAAYRLPVMDRLALAGRAGIGADYARAILDDGVGAPFYGRAWAPVVEGTAAVELLAPTYSVGRVRREILFRLEGGYGWRPLGARLDRLERDYDEDDPIPIQREQVALGNLDLSGFVIRGAIGYRF